MPTLKKGKEVVGYVSATSLFYLIVPLVRIYYDWGI